jgi:hypothetical protein
VYYTATRFIGRCVDETFATNVAAHDKIGAAQIAKEWAAAPGKACNRLDLFVESSYGMFGSECLAAVKAGFENGATCGCISLQGVVSDENVFAELIEILVRYSDQSPIHTLAVPNNTVGLKGLAAILKLAKINGKLDYVDLFNAGPRSVEGLWASLGCFTKGPDDLQDGEEMGEDCRLLLELHRQLKKNGTDRTRPVMNEAFYDDVNGGGALMSSMAS